jgi:hypothetical protein
MSQWRAIVLDSLLPRAQDMRELSDAALKELTKLWLNRLFQNGKTNFILEKFKVRLKALHIDCF